MQARQGETWFWGDERPAVEAVVAWAGRRVVSPSDPKTTARPASELSADAGKTLTEDGIGWEAALRVFQDVLVPATRAQDDPMNLAFVPSAPTRCAVAFDLATSAANIFAGIWDAGAGAIFAENEALAWIVRLLAWPEGAGGCFVPGGTIGNLSALATAREDARARRGGRPAAGWALACTEDAHSSVHAAARVLDVEVVTVPVDDRGRLTGTALRRTLDRSRGVFAVVASAGTTNAGVIDDLAGVADVCDDEGIWLHVDGAYGGAALASRQVRGRFEGIERAHSFIVDPHKWLFAPYDCCALVYREPDAARAVHAQRASYLEAIDRDAPNPSDLAISLTRRARGLPFWFSLAAHGTEAYSAAVDHTLQVARAVADGIRASAHLRLVMDPELSIVLFERPGWTEGQYAAWSRRAALDGLILCVPTRWRGRTVLRLAFVNPQTDPDTVMAALQTLR